jgi:hypothetical protein
VLGHLPTPPDEFITVSRHEPPGFRRNRWSAPSPGVPGVDHRITRFLRGTRSRPEGDSRSAAKRWGSIRADPTARWPESTPIKASVSSDRRAREVASQLDAFRTPVALDS